jgi:hypothetical protein
LAASAISVILVAAAAEQAQSTTSSERLVQAFHPKSGRWVTSSVVGSLETMVGLCNDPAVGPKAIPAA